MAKITTKKGIGYSPLTERVYIGRQNKEKGMWIGDKEDITSDFINTMFAYIPENTNRTIKTIDGLNENIFLNIKCDEASIKKGIKWLEKQLKSA